MHFTSLQVISLVVTISFMSSTVYAAEAPAANAEEQFKSVCLEAWMSRTSENSDKANFKNFGEKYCQCGAGKTLKDENDVKRVAQLCMSETLVQSALSVLEDKQGLSHISSSAIETACQNEWKLVFPKMSEENKQTSITYCQCVAPKLDDLNKTRGSLTTNQWVDKLNAIADNCAAIITLQSGGPAK